MLSQPATQIKSGGFDLTSVQRKDLWNLVTSAVEDFYSHTEDLPVAPILDPELIKNFIGDFAGQKSQDVSDVIKHVIEGLRKFSVHTPHPGYFGLFNPRTNFPGILADTLIAAFNPQLAAWSHAPFAAEVENELILFFGKKFGYKPSETDGVFTTGGAEANLTAILCALTKTFPEYTQFGLRSLTKEPVIYCSAESHHSIVKSVRIAGLGTASVRRVPVNDYLCMNVQALSLQIEHDRRSGLYPLMIIATAGTTGSGAIDPLIDIAQIAEENDCWFHTDAAYGGGLALSSHFHLLNGIDKADSITFDAHKLLSAPMGTSMFLTRHREILSQTFRITAEYMPKEASDLAITDPFVHSIQWSRRFNGLKLYLGLLILGEKAYGNTIDHQIAMGSLLRKKLENHGWQIYNDTGLPVICFGREEFAADPARISAIAEKIIKNGKVWLSVYPVKGRSCLRVCITNYNTAESDLDVLISELKLAAAYMR